MLQKAWKAIGISILFDIIVIIGILGMILTSLSDRSTEDALIHLQLKHAALESKYEDQVKDSGIIIDRYNKIGMACTKNSVFTEGGNTFWCGRAELIIELLKNQKGPVI